MAAFNSPVWFNVGFEEQPQCSACFILSVEDTMDSILDWNTREGQIFRGGSGSGINLSDIRGSMEPLSKGGTASGPVSFMRGADSWAGTIKSGGKTRRAAKMVVLDVDHPDIREFIWCKAKEEDKAAALRDAGLRHVDRRRRLQLHPVPEREQLGPRHGRVHAGRSRTTASGARSRADGRADRRADAGARAHARDRRGGLALRGPGVQYDTTINQWHTSPNSGRINASNPCSEYMHVDDSRATSRR
jgi:ribonucleoside-diphosphate reductase alpha chain